MGKETKIKFADFLDHGKYWPYTFIVGVLIFMGIIILVEVL